tara:strand:+ start:285 stop:2882 length:2598 start_codon:yes stop_codon:yes gene_type:complete
MLITLVSNTNDDAADFSNYFKETILIQPMSELALVNLCYKFEVGITVEEGSNTYEIGMGTTPGLTTLTVAPGSYKVDAFLVALNSSLTTHINGLSYWQQKAFPAAKQTWTYTDDTKSTLELTLEYSPSDWEEFKVLKGADETDATQTMKLIALTDAAMMDVSSKGIVENVTLTDGLISQFNGGFGTNDSDATRTNLWGTAKGNDDGAPYAHIKWSAQQADAAFTIGCADSGLPDWTDPDSLKFCIEVLADGNFVVKERNAANVLTAISAATSYASHKSFEIRVFQGEDKENKYYYDSNEVGFIDGAYRQTTQPGDNLVPAGAFNTKKIVSEVIATLPDGAFSQANSWEVASVPTGGSGYQVGDICTATSAANTVATIRIKSTIWYAGEVSDVEILSNPGGLAGAGETLDIVSHRTNATGCTVKFDNVAESCTLTNPGEGYTTGVSCDIKIGDTTITDAFTAVTTAGGPSGIRLLHVGNSGKPLTVTITEGGAGYSVGDTGTITPPAGSPAQVATFSVASVTGGVVNSLTIADGLYYSLGDACVLANGGASPGGGGGCKVDILTVVEDASGQTYTAGPVEIKKDGQATDFADMTILSVGTGGSVGLVGAGGGGSTPGAGFAVGDFVEIFQPTVISGLPNLSDRAFAKVTGITGQLTDGSTWKKLLTNAGLNAVGNTVCNVIQGGVDLGGTITISAVNATRPSVTELQYDTILQEETAEPLGVHGDAEYVPSTGFLDFTGVAEGSTALADPPLVLTGTTVMTPARQSCQILVNVDQFQLKSMCKDGGVQKAIAAVPMGATAPTTTPTAQISGEFYWEPYNMLYHDLENKSVDNHNQLRVRLTDALGNPLKDLIHPTTLTLDLRPRAK